ncbi:unnamed protein product [Larinioides sclopetarius]|uniref:Uncharacterized protein n=1 Tax=Larinioides sclopetarius TaxID=280406 RepID=A0AAV2ABH4_9ARAC
MNHPRKKRNFITSPNADSAFQSCKGGSDVIDLILLPRFSDDRRILPAGSLRESIWKIAVCATDMRHSRGPCIGSSVCHRRHSVFLKNGPYAMGGYEVTADSEQPMMFTVCLSAVKSNQWLPPKKSHVGVFYVIA